MNSRVAAIRAELERRGINSSEEQLSPSIPLEDKQRLEEIRAELERRGVNLTGQKEASSQSRDSLETLIGKGLATGALSLADLPQLLSSLSHKGMMTETFENVPAAEVPSGVEAGPLASEKIKKGIQNITGVDIEPHPETPLERIATRGAEFAGALAMPGGIASLPARALTGAAIGGTSGLAQELGANPLAADIASTLAAPGLMRAGKGIGKAAAYPLSPSVRENVAQKAASKEASNILQEVTKGVPNPEEAINVPKALQQLEPRVNAEEAGENIRKALAEKLETHKKARSEATEPLYKKLETLEEGMHPLKAAALLEKELKTAKGSVRNSLEKIQEELKPNVKLSKEDLRNQKIHEEYKGLSPEAFKLIQTQFPVKGSSLPKPAEIDNTIKEVSDEIAKAYRSGATQLAKKLEGVKSALEEDFKSLPEGLAHRQKYAELSEPINAIKEHRTLGKIVEKESYGKRYKLGAAEIPREVVNTSMKSVQDSKDFIKQIGKDKKAMEALYGYMNHELLEKITNDTGKVSLSKLETWRKSHPGAFILYPQLETKLKNLTNAQFMVNQIEAKANHLPTLEAFQKLPLRVFKKLSRKVVGGDMLLNFLSKVKDTAKVQKRDELIQQALIDPQVAKLLMTPLKEKGKIEKLSKHLGSYGPRLSMMTGKTQTEE